MHKTFLILFTFLLLTACQNAADHSEPGAPIFKEIPSPAGEGGEPNLFVSADGQVYLSWIGYRNDSTDVLLFSKLENEQWTEATEIAQGTDWFVNWADFPSLVVFSGNPKNIAAHWLQTSAAGTYDYDVRIAQSKDGGKSWSLPFTPHTDGIAAEHGFVSMLPLDNGNIFTVWLDGRNTKGGEEHTEEHGHGGAMSLRTAEFDEAGHLYQEAGLDDRVCDCCQTDVALSAAGPIVVYRDRSEEEIRDISIVRKINGTWTEPRRIHPDNWKIRGCPVNGPAIAALEQSIAIAWYTAADNKPQVKVMLSKDAGKTFTEPILVDDGTPVGRVDIVLLDQETTLVSWLEEVEKGGEIRLAKVNAKGKMGESIKATKTGVSRQSGFPILERVGKEFLLAWTSVEDEPTVRTMLISFSE